ncbi:MAG: hypothetical protein GY851_03635 [bacterium]|nr:hypothetical protein [bacterium]
MRMATTVTRLCEMYRQQASPTLIEDYCRSLSDIRPEDVEAAAGEAMKIERFLPTPAALRDISSRLRRRETEEVDRRHQLTAPRHAPSHATLYQKTRDAIAEGSKGHACSICHDGGYVYIEAKNLPDGGDLHDSPDPGMKGIRYPGGMAYFSLVYPGLVCLRCHCGTVKNSEHAFRVQVGYKTLGIHVDEVCSYYDKWAEAAEVQGGA